MIETLFLNIRLIPFPSAPQRSKRPVPVKPHVPPLDAKLANDSPGTPHDHFTSMLHPITRMVPRDSLAEILGGGAGLPARKRSFNALIISGFGHELISNVSGEYLMRYRGPGADRALKLSTLSPQ
jgi:hypothetical protein